MATKSVLLRLTANAKKAVERATAAKAAVRAAKSTLKDARKALKTAKKAAKEVRRKLETAGATATRARGKVVRRGPAKKSTAAMGAREPAVRTPATGKLLRTAGKPRVRKTAAKPDSTSVSSTIVADEAEASQAALASTLV